MLRRVGVDAGAAACEGAAMDRGEEPPCSPSRCRCIAAAPAGAAEPKLTVAKAKLDAALHCTDGIDDAARTPLMIVTGTGASGAEAYGIAKPALDLYGAPVCYVDFPNFTTADMQVSVQYLVHGLRVMSRRAGRRVAVFGISQGGLLPRIALTYWPSLRAKVSDVIAAAGTQHGTTVGRATCAQPTGCVPAGVAAGGRLEVPAGAQRRTGRDAGPDVVDDRALRDRRDRPAPDRRAPDLGAEGRDERADPGRLPRPRGDPHRHGAGLRHVGADRRRDRPRGPAKVSRLPADVCSHPFAPGLDESATRSIIDAAGGLTSGRYDSQPKVRREPKLKPWAKAGRR